MVSDQLLPALEDSQLSKAAREAATQLSHLDVDKFPLGFTTGGACDMHIAADRSYMVAGLCDARLGA